MVHKMSTMKVKLATQVFSSFVASSMGYLADKGILPKENKDTADVILFFDSLNGSYSNFKKRGKNKLLGPVKSKYHEVWLKAKTVLQPMRFLTKTVTEQGFLKASSANLPRIDILKTRNVSGIEDLWSAQFRNVKASTSAKTSYGDDAIRYVQLKRPGILCIIKTKVCPEHKVHGKLYGVSLVVDEQEETVKSVECHDCVASQGGCKHAMTSLMWLHRRSEELSCTSIDCYWEKSKLPRVGSNLKYITAKELSKASSSLPSNTKVFVKFLEEGKRRRINNCELIKYQSDYVLDRLQSLLMDNLVLKNKERYCDTFLGRVTLSDADMNYVEKETREHHKSRPWYELRHRRVTASRAYEFSRCKTSDGTLMAVIMGGKIPDATAMKHGRILEHGVRKTVSAEPRPRPRPRPT